VKKNSFDDDKKKEGIKCFVINVDQVLLRETGFAAIAEQFKVMMHLFRK